MSDRPDCAPEEEKFDFNSPEDVLIAIGGPHDNNIKNKDWKNWSIEICGILNCTKGTIGAAQYEIFYSGLFGYTLMDLIDCPGAGWFVVEGITAEYTKGDGWKTDNEIDFYCEGIRPATPEEIGDATEGGEHG